VPTTLVRTNVDVGLARSRRWTAGERPVRSHVLEERQNLVDVCEVRLVPRDVRAILEPPRIVSWADEVRHGHPVGQQSPHDWFGEPFAGSAVASASVNPTAVNERTMPRT
jgi:hypothetical protein